MTTRRGWFTIPLLLVGCGQVLGIEGAHVDPSLEGSGGGASSVGSASGTAGSASFTASGGDESPTAVGAAGAAGALELAGAAGASGAGTGGGSAGGGSLCDQYCAAVTSGCTDKHTQYLDLQACLAICPLLPVGAPGDNSGNTINCRFTYARKASSEPYTYCTWAGPGGDGKCGSNCEGFCSVMMQECTQSTVDGEDAFFASSSSCLSACAGLKDVGNYSATDSSLQMGGDHVQCRLYHVNAAVSEDDPTTHCPHAVGKTLCHAP